MTGYRLDVTFYSPCVFYHRPILDSILSYCLQRESHRHVGYYAGTWRDREFEGINRLPEIIAFKGDIPLTTFMQFDQKQPMYIDSWKKRFEPKYARLADFGKARRRIDTSSGQYRSFNMPLQAHVIQAGWFYFIGGGMTVKRLLDKWIWAIGKKPSEGFGVIDHLEVSMWDLIPRDILAARPVPIEIAREIDLPGVEQYCAWRPPYWDRKNHARCMVPAEA